MWRLIAKFSGWVGVSSAWMVLGKNPGSHYVSSLTALSISVPASEVLNHGERPHDIVGRLG